MKPTVLMLFGGQSEEYGISLSSAARVLRDADRQSLTLIPLGITRSGGWYLSPDDPDAIRADRWCLPENGVSLTRGGLLTRGGTVPFDAVLPVLHGAYGEDGRLQGYLDTLGIPFGGCGCECSAVCMNKAHTKAILSAAGIPTLPSVTLTAEDTADLSGALRRVGEKMSFPLFLKPLRGGSSLGAGAAYTADDLLPALREALLHDTAVLAEPLTPARECEVAVFDEGEKRTVSLPGEAVITADFYDYHAKYDDTGTTLSVPADIPPAASDAMRQYASRAFDVLGCRHVARFDFFLTPDGVFLNEVNTLPGLTDRSLYPLLLENAGIPFPTFLTRWCNLSCGTR